MTTKDVVEAAEQIAAKFGFLSRETFFEVLSPFSQSHTYRMWNSLMSSGRFILASGSDDILYLSLRRRRQMPLGPVPVRNLVYVEHDNHVANICFRLRQTGVLRRVWSEQQLSQSPWDAANLLGVHQLDKIPDLVVDLHAGEQTLRVAIEIERRRKSKLRYDQVAAGYLRMAKIDLVIYGCENRVIENEVRRAFSGELFRTKRREPGIYDLGLFRKLGLHAPIEIFGRSYSLVDFLKLALKSEINLPPGHTPKSREKNEKPFSTFESEIERGDSSENKTESTA